MEIDIPYFLSSPCGLSHNFIVVVSVVFSILDPFIVRVHIISLIELLKNQSRLLLNFLVYIFYSNRSNVRLNRSSFIYLFTK